MNNITISLIPATGMIIVAAAAVFYWRRLTMLQFKWFWAGAGLWIVAVILKLICALLANEAVMGFLKERLSYWAFVSAGGLFIGIQSSIFEIGLTLLAVLIWLQFGQDARRAIGIGIGAGAFEAIILGIASLTSIILFLAGVQGTEKIGESIDTIAATTPVFWLIAPVERIIAIGCHTSSRALILLGVTQKKPAMVFLGFLIFTLLDSVAGAAHVAGKIGQISMWWIELALLPFFLISIPIIRWCYIRWNEPVKETV